MTRPNRTFLDKVRRETALLLGLDLRKVKPVDVARLDLAVSLRLGIDQLQSKIANGEPADMAKLLSASEALSRLLPSPVHERPSATAPEMSAERARAEILRRILNLKAADQIEWGCDPADNEALRERVKKLEAELARMRRAAPAVEPDAPAPAEPPPSNVTPIRKALAPEEPAPAAEPPSPQTPGEWDRSVNAAKWRAWRDANGGYGGGGFV